MKDIVMTLLLVMSVAFSAAYFTSSKDANKVKALEQGLMNHEAAIIILAQTAQSLVNEKQQNEKNTETVK